MQLHVSLCGTTVVGSSLENSALSGKLELKLRSWQRSGLVEVALNVWNLLPQSKKEQDCPGTLGTTGSAFAAHSAAATHLAQLGVASPSCA